MPPVGTRRCRGFITILGPNPKSARIHKSSRVNEITSTSSLQGPQGWPQTKSTDIIHGGVWSQSFLTQNSHGFAPSRGEKQTNRVYFWLGNPRQIQRKILRRRFPSSIHGITGNPKIERQASSRREKERETHSRGPAVLHSCRWFRRDAGQVDFNLVGLVKPAGLRATPKEC
jgi:hypothetical protein